MKITTATDKRLLAFAIATAITLWGCGGSAPEQSGRVARNDQAPERDTERPDVIDPVVVRPPRASEEPVFDEEEEWVAANPDDGDDPGRAAALRYMKRGGDDSAEAADEARSTRPDTTASVTDAAPDEATTRPTNTAARSRVATTTTVEGSKPTAAASPARAASPALKSTTVSPTYAATATGDAGTARHLNQQAVAQINSGQHDRAIQALERAVAMQPRDAEMLGNLGYAYMLAGQHGRARTFLMRALEVSPTRSATWLNLGQTYAELGQRDVAVDAVLKGYRYSTRKPSVRSALQRAVSSERHSEAWRTAAAVALTRISA